MTDRDMEVKAGTWARAAQLLEERADRPVADTVELFRWLAEQHQRIAASEAVDW